MTATEQPLLIQALCDRCGRQFPIASVLWPSNSLCRFCDIKRPR